MSPAEAARRAAIALHGALILLAIAQAQSALGWFAALLLVPALPGIVAGRLRTYGWAAMLLVFYCAFWLSDLFVAGTDRVWALVLASVAALDFTALALYGRLKRRERAAAPAPHAETPASGGGGP